MLKRPFALTAVALLTTAAAACTSVNADAEPPGAAAKDGVLHVVAGFYPLQFAVEEVGGDHVSVTNLAQPGTEPHDLELSPRQLATIVDADLVVYLAGFQPAVDTAVAQQATAAFDVAAVVPLRDAAGDPHGHDDEDGEGEDGADGTDGTDGADHELGNDPHVWLDPDRLGVIAQALATRLGELDTAHADAFAAAAADLRQRLDTLDAEYTAGLADCQRREIVVSHAAFGYLAERYDLTQIAVSGLSPEGEPTPGRLAEVIEEAREHSATTIFFETLVSPRVAQVIADEVGAATAVLDPIEGLTPGTADDYFSVMRSNLATLRPALGCA